MCDNRISVSQVTNHVWQQNICITGDQSCLTTEYMYHRWPIMCSVCLSHKSVILSSSKTYQRVFNTSKMTAAICSAETEYPSGPPLSTLIFTRDSYCSFFSFLFNILCIIVCLFVLFPLAIALPVVIRFTASHYPFGISKLFLTNKCIDGDIFNITIHMYMCSRNY